MSAVISPCGVYRYRLERTIGLQQGPVYAYFGVQPLLPLKTTIR